MIKPAWLTVAQGLVGVAEVPGAGNNPVIVDWLIKLKAWWRDDLTPWCGVFVAHCLKSCGIAPPSAWYRAKAFLDWGVTLSAPVYGCIVVFDRKGGGHVGIVVGRDQLGRLMVLGGNQGDRVCIAAFDPARVAGYRWPAEQMVLRQELPQWLASGPASSNEA